MHQKNASDFIVCYSLIFLIMMAGIAKRHHRKFTRIGLHAPSEHHGKECLTLLVDGIQRMFFLQARDHLSTET